MTSNIMIAGVGGQGAQVCTVSNGVDNITQHGVTQDHVIPDGLRVRALARAARPGDTSNDL